MTYFLSTSPAHDVPVFALRDREGQRDLKTDRTLEIFSQRLERNLFKNFIRHFVIYVFQKCHNNLE